MIWGSTELRDGWNFRNFRWCGLMKRSWKSKRGGEVDFVIKEGLKIKEAIQVALSLSDPRVKEREIQGQGEAREELRANRLIILTEDEEGIETFQGVKIEVVPMWKWLLAGAENEALQVL